MALPRNSRQLLLLSGTATIPGLAFANDTNTGIFRTSADRLDITTGGVSRLYVDASGNTTVTGNLTVSGAVTASGSGAVVTVDGTQTLTNKTISGSANTLSNIGNSSLTNSAVTIGSTAVSLGATAATVAGLTLTSPTLTGATLTSPTISTITNTGTLTLPTATDTLVGRTTTDTLSNKTLSSPVLSGSVSGTYTLGGTPTISGAAVSSGTLPNTAITGTSQSRKVLSSDGSTAVWSGLAITANASLTTNGGTNQPTLDFGNNITGVNRTGGGTWQVTMSALSNANYTVAVTSLYLSSNTSLTPVIRSKTTTGFVITFVNQVGNGQDPTTGLVVDITVIGGL